MTTILVESYLASYLESCLECYQNRRYSTEFFMVNGL